MIDLHYWPTPNGHKITIFLEEAKLSYAIHKVDIGKGDQFKPEFLAIAPNNRMPAIVDQAPADGGSQFLRGDGVHGRNERHHRSARRLRPRSRGHGAGQKELRG